MYYRAQDQVKSSAIGGELQDTFVIVGGDESKGKTNHSNGTYKGKKKGSRNTR
jgi:hypothetical protein